MECLQWLVLSLKTIKFDIHFVLKLNFLLVFDRQLKLQADAVLPPPYLTLAKELNVVSAVS